jgi:hypothetical protein
VKGLMLTIALAAALASPAVAQTQWREGPLPPDVQDIKAAGLMPYGKPILPGNWCTAVSRGPLPGGRLDIETWCGTVEAWQRWSKIVCLRAQEGSPSVPPGACLAAQLSSDKVRMAAENADRARQRALDAKRQLHDMGVE